MDDRINYLTHRIADLKRLTEDRGYALILAMELRAAKRDRRVLRSILADPDEVPLGVELTNASGQFLAIVPEPDMTARARIVRFGEDGLYGHEVYESSSAAVMDAIRQGFTRRADGTLDALAGTQRWQRGIQYAELIQRFNAGKLAFDDMTIAANALYTEVEHAA